MQNRKRLIYLCVFLFLFSNIPEAAAWMNPVIAGGGASVSGATYPDIDFYWGCESTTAEKSRGDTTAATTSSEAINNDHTAPVGSYHSDYPSNYDFYTFDVDANDFLSMDEGRLGFYFYCTTWPVAQMVIWQVRIDSSNYIQLCQVGGGDELYVKYLVGGIGAMEVTTIDANMTTGNWYFVELIWENTAASTDSIKIEVDGTERSSDTDTIAQFGSQSPPMNMGVVTAGGNNCIDQVLISDDITRDLNAIKDLTSFPDP